MTGRCFSGWGAAPVILVCWGAAAPPAGAQCELAKLLAADRNPQEHLGGSVSISGDVAVVGADDHKDVIDPGWAYIFRFNGSTWVQEAKLAPSDGGAGDRFGFSVSIDGDVAVVGAFLHDANFANAGAVYLFVKPAGGWEDMTETAKLTAFDAAAVDGFGRSVSLSGDVLVVGADGDDDNGDNSGSVYVLGFNGSTWVHEAKLTASDGTVGDRFGFSASIDGDVAVVGAYLDGSGSAYVFVKGPGGWVDMTQTAKLSAFDGAAGDFFGYSVSISGDVAVVGAVGHDDNGAESGSAYVFEKGAGGWQDMTQTAELTASDGAAGDSFGRSVSIDGDLVIGGASLDDGPFFDSGSAYVFNRPAGGWLDTTETAKLTAPDPRFQHRFGAAVSIRAAIAVVGAAHDADNGTNAGAAYVYGVVENACPPPCPWDCEATPDGFVGITDLFELFGQWTMVGVSCDFDGGGAGITDLFQVFANWGACP